MQRLRASLRCFSNAMRNNSVPEKVKSFSKTAFSDKYLLYTNVTISISLSALGDYLEQNYEIYIKEIDSWSRTRTMHMAFSGMTVGVICHHWYKFLDRKLPGRSLVTVVKKVMLDQTICSPLVITTFFASCALFEDVTMEEFKTELKLKFMKLYAAEWIVWPPAQIINFCFLPTKYRVLYDNTISLGYDVFTSHVKHSKVEDISSEKKIDVILNNEVKSEKPQESLRILELEKKSSSVQNNILTVVS